MLVRPRDLADRMSDRQQSEIFRLPVDAARCKAREIIGQVPQAGRCREPLDVGSLIVSVVPAITNFMTSGLPSWITEHDHPAAEPSVTEASIATSKIVMVMIVRAITRRAQIKSNVVIPVSKGCLISKEPSQGDVNGFPDR